MSGFRTAVQFLTRVPVGGGSADISAAVPWFPLVGALVGVLVGGAYAGLAELVPWGVAAALAVLLGVGVTGVFHEDGLADVSDAFAGGWTRDDRLRILDDPRHGSYGVAALCGSILLRVLSLATLGPAAGFAACVAAHAAGRSAALVTMAAPAAKGDGLGADMTAGLRPRPVAAGVVLGVAITAVAVGWWSGPVLAACALGATVVVWLSMRKIGGVSGDVFGTVEQVGECLTLVVISGLAARHAIWWR